MNTAVLIGAGAIRDSWRPVYAAVEEAFQPARVPAYPEDDMLS